MWQESVSLAGDVIRAVRQGMRRETKSVSDSIMLTALSVGAHIADGYARPSTVEQRESYLAAKRALLRLETELAIARHAELVPQGVLADVSSRSALVARMLTGYLVYLDRQIVDGRGGVGPLAARADLPAEGAPVSLDSARVPS